MLKYSNYTNILHALSILDKLSGIEIDKINYWEMEFIKNANDTLNNISKNLNYGQLDLKLDNVLNKYLNYYTIIIENKINNKELKNIGKTLNKIKNTSSESIKKKKKINQYYEYDTINNIDSKCYLDTCKDVLFEKKTYHTKSGRKCKKINYKI